MTSEICAAVPIRDNPATVAALFESIRPGAASEGGKRDSTLISIVGPTGSGKTDLAVELAMRLGAPIISTDSRQVYRGMRIGSAQPSDEQLRAVPHYFIADRNPVERFTCADFEREALALLDRLFERHRWVVAVGGSGLYIDALCNGLDTLPDVDPELRHSLAGRLAREGLEGLLEQLRELDPVYHEQVDRQNPARVLRALEVCLQTGRPFSSLRTGTKAERPFETIKIGIDLPRAELYGRIDRRVDKMIEQGLEAEARALYPLRHLPSLQTVGYREMFEGFDRVLHRAANLPGEFDGSEFSYVPGSGDYRPAASPEFEAAHFSPDQELEAIPLSSEPELDASGPTTSSQSDTLRLPARDLARAVELIKRNSRRYAKRQLTWFRRDPAINWLSPSDFAEFLDRIEKN